MKPVGLTDPRTGRRPHAVVQLRQDNALGTLYNMVGFQTKLRHGEQSQDLPPHPRPRDGPSLPGSAGCTATPSSTARACSTRELRLKAEPRLRFAGQITGVEGYVESAAIGLLAGRFAAAERLRRAPRSRRRRRPRSARCSRHITGGADAESFPADERQFRPVPAALARSRPPRRPEAAVFPPRPRRPFGLARRT